LYSVDDLLRGFRVLEKRDYLRDPFSLILISFVVSNAP
jgi:hypothetical protein